MTSISNFTPLPLKDCVRDQEFFLDDGDCVVLAGDTLFKIHRFLLARDSSAFTDMFTLPSGGHCPNSMTESEPLVLHDSPEDFRALCWALYALPPEIEAQACPETFRFQNVLHLFSISHKYCLESYEKWAIRLLILHCRVPKNPGLQPPNRVLDDVILCPTSKLELLLRLVVQTNHHDLITSIEFALMRRLEACPSLSIAQTLALAEELNLRRLQAFLYYHELKRQNIFDIDPPTASSLPPRELNSTQAAYFFRGCWSLLSYWTNLPNHARMKNLHPPTREIPTPSDKELQCQAEWEQLWLPENLQKVLGNIPPGSGPLEWLEKLRASRAPGRYQLSIHFFGVPRKSVTQLERCPCSQRELSELFTQLRDALENHFYGLQPEDSQ